jgi:hypothetical protein
MVKTTIGHACVLDAIIFRIYFSICKSVTEHRNQNFFQNLQNQVVITPPIRLKFSRLHVPLM